ncbi:MAG: hypothetical protein HZB62_12025 [Nitrospirae bacterium]|nr:hypothetical protein [Nitrospirota bacterium]
MDHKYNPALRVISTIVLSFFLWSFGGVFDVAYAVKESSQPSAISAQRRNDSSQSSAISSQHQTKKDRAEEKFSKAIDDIEKILSDQPSALSDQQKRLKAKKAEIELHDIEIRKQFTETEGKIKDLPDVIKKRHRDFVKHYDDNLRELKTNLDEIDKAKDKTEVEVKVEKAKRHLEKIKPPKKHRALDPNKLPHRTEEPVFKEPRTKPEEFEKDSGQQSALSSQIDSQISPNPSLQKRGTGVAAQFYPTLTKGGEGGFFGQSAKPILVAANGSLDGLLSPSTTPPILPLPRGGWEGWSFSPA